MSHKLELEKYINWLTGNIENEFKTKLELPEAQAILKELEEIRHNNDILRACLINIESFLSINDTLTEHRDNVLSSINKAKKVL